MNLKEKFHLNNAQLIILLVAAAVTIFGIVETLLHVNAGVPVSKSLFVCLGFLSIIYYALYGYKVPHGNHLKGIILLFALILVDGLGLEAGRILPGLTDQAVLYSACVTGVCIGIVCYVAGRLHKFNQNIYLITLTTILLIVRIILMLNARMVMFGNIADAIIWVDITCVYAIRYKQHREAGLQA